MNSYDNSKINATEETLLGYLDHLMRNDRVWVTQTMMSYADALVHLGGVENLRPGDMVQVSGIIVTEKSGDREQALRIVEERNYGETVMGLLTERVVVQPIQLPEDVKHRDLIRSRQLYRN